MPPYINTPFKPTPVLAISGSPTYLFGSFNDKTGPTLGQVQTVAAVTTTGTVVFLIRSGNAPVVGAKISVRGVAASGNFNVSNGTILTASTNTSTGVCTVTYAIASTTQSTVADNGEVAIFQPEVAETLANGASAPVSVSFATATPQQDRAITVVTSFPSLPTACTVSLQQAVYDIDSEYATINTVATVSGGAVTAGGQVTVDPALGRFFRVLVASVSGGTLPTIVCKLVS